MKWNTTTITFSFLFTLIVLSCYFMSASCDSSASSTSVKSNPKKLRGLGPSANRLFHLLRLGVGGSVDDEDLQSDDDNFMQKRQYDDYGHMRFGKRGYDDYGHLRFGK